VSSFRPHPPFGSTWRSFTAWLLAAVGLNLPNFIYPFFEDSALFAVVGKWMHAGLLPDRDVVAMKPPAIYLVTYVTYGLFGNSPLGSRVVELLFILVTAVAVGRIAERFTGIPGWWSALLCAALSSGALWGLAERGQVEFYQAAALGWGCCLLLEGSAFSVRPYLANLVAAGGLFALAAWFKPQAALLGFLLVIVMALTHSFRDGIWTALRAIAAVGLGAGLVCSVFTAWLWLAGALRPFLVTMLVVNRDYLRLGFRPSLAQALAAVRPYDMPAPTAGMVTIILLVGVLALFQRRSQPAGPDAPVAIVLLLWLFSALVQFWSGGYFFNYHKVILVAPVSCFVAIGSCRLLQAIQERLPRSVVRLHRVISVFAAVAFFGVLVLTPKLLVDSWVFGSWVAGSETRQSVHCRFGKELHFYDYCAQLAAAQYVRARTQPTDRVQAIDIGAAFYLNADRLPATRFVLAGLALDPRYNGKADRFREFMTSLEQRPPVYLMVRTNDFFPWLGLPAGYRMIEAEPSLQRFVRDHYVMEGEVSPGFLAFHLRRPTS
jgi:hypothetical protein